MTPCRGVAGESTADVIDHPAHYTAGPIECIDAIAAQLTQTEYRGYLRGNIVKYLWRYPRKGHSVEDLNKARWYLDRLIAMESSK